MKIGIIGLGLIGGSIAIKLKEKLGADIVAYNRREESLISAYKDGVISKYSTESLDIFEGCDIIFVCTPVDKITLYCEKLKPYINSDTIITDVGSTKNNICKKMAKMKDISFIGGHPMAGTECSGYKSAKKDLFNNAVYIIAPLPNSKKEHIERLKAVIIELGAKPVIMDCETHDGAVAAVSHVPHIIAYALANEVSELEDEKMSMQTLAAGGFKDTTRIASSNPEVWSAICEENKEQVVKTTEIFIEKMQEALEYIKNDNYKELSIFFQNAKEFRDGLKKREEKQK